MVYAANLTETPRSLKRTGVFSGTDGTTIPRPSSKDGHTSNDRPATIKVLLVPFVSVFVSFLSNRIKPQNALRFRVLLILPFFFLD